MHRQDQSGLVPGDHSLRHQGIQTLTLSSPPTLDEPPLARTRPAYFPACGWLTCAVQARAALVVGAEHPGPLIIESMDSTVLVPPDWRASVNERGFIIMEPTA